MAIYSSRLFISHALDSETLPSDPTDTWVIRTVTIFWPASVTPVEFQLVDTATDATLLYAENDGGFPGLLTTFTDLRLIIPPLSYLNWSGVGSPDVSASGYALTP